MTTRDRVRRLAEVLPDVLPDAELDTAVRILEALAGNALDPAARAALLAPDDDEPLTDAERAGIAEGLADLAAGRVTSLDALRAEWAAEDAHSSAERGS